MFGDQDHIHSLRGILNKGNSTNSLHRGMGPTAIGAVARSISQVTQPEPDDSVRYLASAKCNVGPKALTATFQVRAVPGGIPRVEWKEEVEDSAHKLNLRATEASVRKLSLRGIAVDFLRDELDNGPVLVEEIQARASQSGIKWKTLERASLDLKVKRGPVNPRGKWQWRGAHVPHPTIARLARCVVHSPRPIRKISHTTPTITPATPRRLLWGFGRHVSN